MRNRLVASLVGFLLGAGTLLAQPPAGKSEKLPLPEPVAQPPGGKSEKVPPPKPVQETPKKKAGDGPATPPADGARPLLRGGDFTPWLDGGEVWTSAEFLLMWAKEPKPLPPLFTGPPIVDEFGNVLAATVLVGNASYDYDEFAGLRLRGGYWFDGDRALGLEASLLFLGKRSFGIRRDDLPILSRPFFDLNTGTESNVIIALPGVAAGGFNFRTTSRNWGLETNVWKNLYYEPLFKCVRADLICGLRYLDLAEDIRIDRATTFNPDLVDFPQFLPLQSNRILETEGIRAHNHFWGAQSGVSVKVFDEHWVLDVTGKIAMGVNHETLHITGEHRRIRPNGVTTVTPGGLFALPSNMGKHNREQFSYVPEITVNFGLPLGNHAGIYIGYNFLYWSKVARPGDQIDRVVDSSQIPSLPPPLPATTGQGRPSVPWTQSHWQAMGLTLGLEFSW